MEGSLSSSVNNSIASKETNEESGWTDYFEDFFSNQIEQSSNCAGSFGSPCLVSDAASCVARKGSNNINHVAVCSSMDGSPKFPQKLNFRKTRAKEISYYDDSLEDTASSPVNSPKVSSLKQMDINHRKTDDNNESSLGKGGGCDHHLQVQTDKRGEMNFDGKNNDCTELKKRGLCLVPLSMFVNYLG